MTASRPTAHRSGSAAPSASRGWAVALGLAALVLVWTRLVGLDASLVQDEVATVERFIEAGPARILAGEYELNNHALFNLLTWATIGVFDPSEPVYRLWGVLPAIASVIVLAWWCLRRIGPLAAVVFALLAVVSPLTLSLGVQARGYGIGFLSMALMVVLADRWARRGERWALAGFGIAAVAGIWTYPLVLLAFAGVAGALILRVDLRRRALWATAAVVVATAAFYAPVAGDILGRLGRGGSAADRSPGTLELASSESPVPGFQALAAAQRSQGEQPPAGYYHLSWYELPVAWLPLVVPTAELVATGTEPGSCNARCYSLGALVVYGAVPVVLVALGGLALWRRRERTLLAILTLPLAATYLVLWAVQVFVLDRYHSFLLLPIAVLMAAGLSAVFDRLRTWPRLRTVGLVGLAALAVFASFRVIALSEQWRELPVENHKRVGEVIEGSDIDRVVTNSIRPTGLRHYIGERKVDKAAPEALQAELCAGTAPLVYVDHRFRTPPLAGPAAACLSRRGGVPVRVPQRRRGDFVVWIVPAPAAAGRPPPGGAGPG